MTTQRPQCKLTAQKFTVNIGKKVCDTGINGEEKWFQDDPYISK